MIAFLGSVFSPYYAWSGRQDPLNHCSINVALYGPSGSRWSMTERNRPAIERSADMLRIGPSSLAWDNGALVGEIDEVAAPFPRRLRGTLRVVPFGLPKRCFALDDADRHVWQPIAPWARIEVDFRRPQLRWTGTAYIDSNFGCEPLESCFQEWAWSRAHVERNAVIFYDTLKRDGTPSALGLCFRQDETIPLDPPPRLELRKTAWRLPRVTRADQPADVKLIKTLEDGPFYARSLLATSINGRRAMAIHESLSLARFQSNLVRAMLLFRMPRRAV